MMPPTDNQRLYVPPRSRGPPRQGGLDSSFQGGGGGGGGSWRGPGGPGGPVIGGPGGRSIMGGNDRFGGYGSGYSHGYGNAPRHTNSNTAAIWNDSTSGGRDTPWEESSGRALIQEDGTWATRGGRPHYNENESEVFKNAQQKSTGINFDSYDSINVEVSGNNTQQIEPLSSFKDAPDIPAPLMKNILRVKYDKPTPVQKYGIPIILKGRDLMACAQTGSGKTAAFLFPVIIKMLRKGPPPVRQGSPSVPRPVTLVLSPTRELACQIYEEGRKFAFQTGIRTVVIYGGAELRAQCMDLGKGCDICVATPGRMNDIFERRRISLAMIEYLILDEADRMLDLGFAPQIREIVENSDMPRHGRQTVMFSATFPRQMQQLASSFLTDYVYLAVGRVGSTNEFITQRLIYADEPQKPRRLTQLLKESTGKVLVFVETKKKADMIEAYLLKNSFDAISIHGDRTQSERTRALEAFKSGQRNILVATDVAARGLDVHGIQHVINCDLPGNIEDYVHRIGRTGRAGNAGLASSFVDEGDKPILRDLLSLLQESNQEVPSWFADMTRQCSSAHNAGFGYRGYGGGSARRGGGGGGGGGGGQSGGAFMMDSRDVRDGADRRTYKLHGNSPRGGGAPMGRGPGYEDWGSGKDYMNTPAPARTGGFTAARGGAAKVDAPPRPRGGDQADGWNVD